MTQLTRAQKYIPDFVYGAIDGTITTFAVVAGVIGADLSIGVILILGISNVLADGWSMASSNYLASRAEAATLGVGEAGTPIYSAMITFLSFVVVGMIPILPFLCALFIPWFFDHAWVLSIIGTGLAFILIGSARGTVTGENKFRASLETLAVGALAALIAYGVGSLLSGIA
ncbi:VIT1/CCC1 transporter family protein [Candidatus Nomurabacteria bacterium]|nr:VIT1/CCC1 transporter family protein [Candidatus Nomurabacteria bacterium]